MNFKNLQAMLSVNCPGYTIESVTDICTSAIDASVLIECTVSDERGRPSVATLAMCLVDELGIWTVGFDETQGPDPRNPWND